MIQFWGPKTWKLIHCVSQNYPNNPTVLDKQYYTYFFYCDLIMECIEYQTFSWSSKVFGASYFSLE